MTSQNLLPNNFQGTHYRLTNNWFPFIPLDSSQPIKYLEIGTFIGANIISCTKTYGTHPNSLLYGIDPYIDYKDYNEYVGKISESYEILQNNLKLLDEKERKKITIFRDYSHDKIPKLINEYFDIIYIDGNHNPEYVLEDAILSFRKLKKNGYMIFDDYGWNGENGTKRGIDAFLYTFHHKIKVLGIQETQVFIQKLD